MKSSYDIGTEIDGLEDELSEALKNQLIIEEELLQLSKKILQFQITKKDLQSAKSKADHVVKQINLNLRLKRNAFFSAKNSGL